MFGLAVNSYYGDVLLFNIYYVIYRWLDSNRSLMEQGILESDLLYLKYKYFT